MSHDNTQAFGAPGMPPRWTSSSKEGIGTAYNTASRLWFTLSHGVVNEVYYPTVDRPNTRDLQLLITDGETFVHEERRDLNHQLDFPEKGALAYELSNRDPKGRYEIRKTVISDPHLPVLLIRHRLVIHDQSLRGKLRLYLLLAPHIEGIGSDNNAELIEHNGTLVLHAWRKATHLTCAASPPLIKGSAGYVGASDGWQDLTRHKTLHWNFRRALCGNVALIGEIQANENGEFLVALGFGSGLTSALTTTSQSLAMPFERSYERFIHQWSRVRHEHDETPELVAASSDSGSLYRLSRCILQAHEDKLYQGALIASLSIPWGNSKGDADLGGYHLLWPRDLLHSTSALLVSGQQELPLRALIYLSSIQRDDGSMPQNCWIDGDPYWTGMQLDESAAPLILAHRLASADALQHFDPWPLVSRASAYLLLNGPSTGQERWEENSGYSPSTLADLLAAVFGAAELAAKHSTADSAADTHQLLLAYADWLQHHIPRWTSTSHGTLDPTIPHHFVRIVPAAPDLSGPAGDPADLSIQIGNGGGQHRASDIVDAGFLNLVRYGFLDPHDPLITDSLTLIDAELKVDFPSGPCWRRYQFDGYGSHPETGAGFDGSGYGGCWPLLIGERAHAELAAGHDVTPLLRAYESFANEGGMLPEQIWPLDDVGPMKFGQAAGSSMPLCWAHAEYISLIHSLQLGHPVDRFDTAWSRYVENKPARLKTQFWSLAHRSPSVEPGQRLILLLDGPIRIDWHSQGKDNWQQASAKPRLARLHTLELGPLNQPIEFRLEGHPDLFTVEVCKDERMRG